jgi:hypothetical protein
VPTRRVSNWPCDRARVRPPSASQCHLPAPGYDQLAERRFEFIPLWGFLGFLLYTMRRVDSRRCGVVAVEEVPWGDGKRTLTKAYMLLSDRSRRHTPALGGPRKNHRILSGIFHRHRRRTGFKDRVRLLRYVGALSEGHSREMFRGPAYSRLKSPSDSAPSAASNSRSITHLASCPSRNRPTNSSDEPKF